ncbi:hypothetical protein llap_11842 [Limosa lapponica baueri]|uniref:Uncharacterized protein n=1 Tax=Limosa lapponica baueri TaxID=1758121 RepID=A0A2I0TVV6_LIMLA|nr:hypothetical protein llap_11842 [Limosa lapponica baueri]
MKSSWKIVSRSDFNSSVVPDVRRRFALLCLVPLSPPCSSSFAALQVFGRDGADGTLRICERQGPRPPAMASSLTWDLCIGRGKPCRMASRPHGYLAPLSKSQKPCEMSDSDLSNSANANGTDSSELSL